MYHRITKILLISGVLFILPHIAQAGFLDDVAYCTGRGDCSVADIAIAFSSLIQLLLGAMGAVALLFFVWGGIRWLISGGSAEKVNQGKTIMLNTVFALILAFGSYLILTFFVNDVLNVRQEFRIEEGEFASCQGAARGTSCGADKQCSGVIPPGPVDNFSEKCLTICEIQALSQSADTRTGQCVSPPIVDLEPVPNATGICPNGQVCVYN
ncbi:MAG: pilin [Patescibacteria group bacterium]|jgi:hypothetical protein